MNNSELIDLITFIADRADKTTCEIEARILSEVQFKLEEYLPDN